MEKNHLPKLGTVEEEKKSSNTLSNTSGVKVAKSTGKSEPLSFPSAADYTTKNITNRWEDQRDAWLNASGDTKSKNASKEPDVRGTTPSKPVPLDQYDPERKALKKTMKSVQGPYARFSNYYPLEEIIDLYMEIWYDSDSDSDD